jgi:sugar-specific transcriptional regulator TrmB
MKPDPAKTLQDILQRAGLGAVDASLYLSCLKLGTQSADVIARDAGLSVRDALAILRQLQKRGFVSCFTTSRDFFTAESPEIVASVLEHECYEMRKSLDVLKTELPAFSAFIDPSHAKPEVTFHRGKEGIIAAYEDTLTSKTDILAITSVDDTEAMLPEYAPRYYLRRKAAGILIRAIFADSPHARTCHARDATELRESRVVPAELLKGFHLEYYIYDDKVAYFSVVEGIAVIIKSSFIADGMRTVFSLLWKTTAAADIPLSKHKSVKDKRRPSSD